jgi:DNA polymerase-3 subunit alpha (Gram-positive type)
VPRIPRSVLDHYRDGLLIGTACSKGEVFTAMMEKGLYGCQAKSAVL